MNRILILILISLSHNVINGQSQEWIDSLKANEENEIIVFKTTCVGCIVTSQPCGEYVQNGNPWDKYIFWKNSGGYHVKRFNNCGSSDILKIKKWKNNPFEIVDSNLTEIDTIQLKYPLSFNRDDSTWFETSMNHLKYYRFSFPSYSLKEIKIKDYAFRKEKEDDEIWAIVNFEFKKNQNRYAYNNSTVIKELLDVILMNLNKKERKLKITMAKKS